MNKKMNFSKLMKKNTALSLSLILAVCGVLTGCSGSSTKEESALEITTTTKATTVATTKMTTAATTTTPLYSPISDTNGKIFNIVKAGMSKEEILELFGEPVGDSSGDYIDYYVDSNSYLDSYVTYDYEKDVTSTYRKNLVTASYKYWYTFSFKNGKLYSWDIMVNDHFDSSVSDCIINTIVPILQKDYPGLERFPDIEDVYLIAYNYTFNNKENAVLTYDEVEGVCGEISFTDYRYYHSKSGNYDKNDKYYSNNDANNDGYIDDKEFQNAVDDYMSDHGY